MKYILLFLFLLGMDVLHAQFSQQLRINLSGNVKTSTIRIFRGNWINNDTIVPKDTSDMDGIIEFYSKEKLQDSTYSFGYWPGIKGRSVLYRAVYEYGGVNNAISLKTNYHYMSPGVISSISKSEYTWLGDKKYEVKVYDKNKTVNSLQTIFLDSQFRDSLISFVGYYNLEISSKYDYSFIYPIDFSGCKWKFNNLKTGAVTEGIRKNVLFDKFGNPTLIYELDAEQKTVTSMLVISYLYYE